MRMKNEIFPPMWQIIPKCEKGSAKIEHFKVSKAASSFSIFSYSGGDWVPEGKYARLCIDKILVMTDTRMEKIEYYEPVNNSHGDVLIGGLGMGLILIPIMAKKEVKTITVIEKNQDVIDLILPHLRNYDPQGFKKITVIKASMLEWIPPKGTMYNTIYFDIWTDIDDNNYEEMKMLHRRFGRKKVKNDPEKWMGSWTFKRLQHERRTRSCCW